MDKGANNTYWGNIKDAVSSLIHGLKLTVRHLWEARASRKPIGISEKSYFDQKEGIVTLQYPNESLPVPDNGRYRLHNEIADCIVCDKCAKICPVNCIEIEPIRAVGEDLGKTSDGTPKRIHAAKFDIDMGKCCFCGLCTTVCPTECLTMTKAYDFSEYDVAEHIYAFGEMTPLEILEKQEKLEAFQAEKAKTAASTPQSEQKPIQSKPALRPRVSTPGNESPPKADDSQTEAPRQEEGTVRPTFRPKVKPQVNKDKEETEKRESNPVKAKPVFKPKIKPVVGKEDPPTENAEIPQKTIRQEGESVSDKKPRPVFRPKMKPVIKKEGQGNKEDEENTAGTKPVLKPENKPVEPENKQREEKSGPEKKPRPVFKPKIKPKKKDNEE